MSRGTTLAYAVGCPPCREAAKDRVEVGKRFRGHEIGDHPRCPCGLLLGPGHTEEDIRAGRCRTHAGETLETLAERTI